MFDVTTTQVVNDAIVFGAGLLSVFGIGKSKSAQSFFGFLKKEEPVIVKAVEDMLSSPEAKAIEAKLKVELAHVQSQLADSELAKLAAQALHGVGVGLSNLTPEQMNAITLHIATVLPGVSKAKIEAALSDAQKAADSVAGVAVIQAANKFAQEKADATIAASKVDAANSDAK